MGIEGVIMMEVEGILRASPPPAGAASVVGGSKAHQMLGSLGTTEAPA